jgi:hypothetical protein
MKEQRTSSGSSGTPIKLRANANRQTEEQYSPRLTRTRQWADVLDDGIDDGWTIEKNHTSAIRYDRPPRRETTHLPPAKATKVISSRRFTLARFLVMLGLLLFVLALGIMAFNALSSWWQLHTDDVTYGRPRTYQTDAYVGQGDSPAHPNHFLALNLNGVVEVVEINTQNARLDHMYYITITNSPLNPVTLSFPTVDGKQYMYVSIGEQNSAYTVALVNDGKAFVGAQH